MQRTHIFLWLGLLAAVRCDAAIYQWIDSAGTTQFGDRPPAGQAGVIERRDIEADAVAPPPQPSPPRRAAPAKATADKPPKTRRRTARLSERELAHQRCDKIRRRIDHTLSEMRAGYSARRGIKLNERLRADRDKVFHDCRYR